MLTALMRHVNLPSPAPGLLCSPPGVPNVTSVTLSTTDPRRVLVRLTPPTQTGGGLTGFLVQAVRAAGAGPMVPLGGSADMGTDAGNGEVRLLGACPNPPNLLPGCASAAQPGCQALPRAQSA